MKLPAELLLRFCFFKALRFFSAAPRMLIYRDFLSAGSSIDWAVLQKHWPLPLSGRLQGASINVFFFFFFLN